MISNNLGLIKQEKPKIDPNIIIKSASKKELGCKGKNICIDQRSSVVHFLYFGSHSSSGFS